MDALESLKVNTIWEYSCLEIKLLLNKKPKQRVIAFIIIFSFTSNIRIFKKLL